MSFILIFLSILMMLLFLMMNHPLTMGLILLMQTVLVSLISGFYTSNFWFSYIMFLIMIGGMLVIFIYMTSIASNEKFKFNSVLTYSTVLIALNLSVLMSDLNSLNMNNFINPQNSLTETSLSKFLNFPSNICLTLMIIYLFVTLVAVVKISKVSYGPLREKF